MCELGGERSSCTPQSSNLKGFAGTRDPTTVLLDQEGGGRHRAERVLNAELLYVWYLFGWSAKKFDYMNHVINASAYGLRVYVYTLSPLVAMHLHG